MRALGKYLRSKREKLKTRDRSYSLRQEASRIKIEPSYLSKVERDEPAPLSEEKIRALAKELGEDPDLLLALSNKVSRDVLEIIRERPRLFAPLIRNLKDTPDETIKEILKMAKAGSFQRRET